MISSETRSKRGGFTLVELITVITIIAILFALGVGITSSTTQGTALTAAGETLYGKLIEVQQRAIASNSPVDVIFYTYADEFGVSEVRGVGFFEQVPVVQPTGGVVVTLKKAANDHVLTAPMVISSGEGNSKKLSTLVDPSSGGGLIDPAAQPTPDPFLEDDAFAPAANDAARTYTGFRFLPDGSTTLSPTTVANDQWHLTIVRSNPGGATNLETSAPSNYFCIRVDPHTGRLERWRP